jgi:hypothetical protein
MIYLATIVFPLISIGCGIAVTLALTAFVKDIRRNIRGK